MDELGSVQPATGGQTDVALLDVKHKLLHQVVSIIVIIVPEKTRKSRELLRLEKLMFRFDKILTKNRAIKYSSIGCFHDREMVRILASVLLSKVCIYNSILFTYWQHFAIPWGLLAT